jgi:hypothetical protein
MQFTRTNNNFTGVNHEQLVSLGEKLFGDASLNYEHEIPTLSPCRFTGSEVGYCWSFIYFYVITILVQ